MKRAIKKLIAKWKCSLGDIFADHTCADKVLGSAKDLIELERSQRNSARD